MDDRLNWRDVITLEEPNLFFFEQSSPEQVQEAFQQIEEFLDFVEVTPKGQEMLHAIQEKYAPREHMNIAGGAKLEIGLNDNFRSATWSDGNISIDIRFPDYHAFIDQRSGEAVPFNMERMVFHELVHAADPRVGFNDDNKGPDYDTVVEEFATSQTDEFGREVMPAFGVRGAYGNDAGSCPEPIFDDPGMDGIKILEQNSALRGKIQGLVETVDERVKDAQQKLDAGEGEPALKVRSLGFSFEMGDNSDLSP